MSVSVRCLLFPAFCFRFFLPGATFDYLEGRDIQDPRLEEQIAESYVAVLLIRTADGVSFGIGLMRLPKP